MKVILVLLIISLLHLSVRTQDFKRFDEISGLPVKPEKCYGTDEIMDRRCCIFPPFYVREVARECGAIFALMLINNKANVTTLRRESPTGCEHWKCVLTKYALVSDDGQFLNNEKFFLHLDKWVELNPEFKSSMLRSKTTCKRLFKFFMPISVCEYFHYHECIRRKIVMDCPRMIQDELCNKQKEFYNECRQYF